jgi:hypothetical protein
MPLFSRPRRTACSLTVALSAAVLAFFTGAAGAVPAAIPAESCTTSPYAYAGLFSNSPAPGIETVLTSVAAAQVPYGHTAGWIGVGGADAGPNGEAEWLQTGLASMAGGANELYAEITTAGSQPRYVTLVADVPPGTSYRVAVVRVKRNAWQVMLNGKPATGAIYLPGSQSFEPMAMSESWNGGMPDCNGYRYRFGGLRVATANGAWKALTNASTLADDGYEVVDRTQSGFTAVSA